MVLEYRTHLENELDDDKRKELHDIIAKYQSSSYVFNSTGKK